MVSLTRIIHRMQRHREKGFTLIELMIVVAILGILAAIAIPNFMRFQAKSKQSEAKTNLGAVGTTAEAFRSENDTYVATWAQLGWAPQGSTRYAYGYGGNVLSGTPSLSGNCASVATDQSSGASGTAFTAIAHGDVDTDTTCDTWRYTQSRTLTNVTNDVGS